jgi:hypothetical protein
MNNIKWSNVSLIVSVLVVLVGLFSINVQADNYAGIRQSYFLMTGYSCTFSLGVFFALLAMSLRNKKG